ncbi:MAG: flagellar type III secretion system pore protein FliP [Planctomycetaceae bacterium]|nr:flagellar type III secretion system pore protein FliP [Planctomycetaceae bacterium]
MESGSMRISEFSRRAGMTLRKQIFRVFFALFLFIPAVLLAESSETLSIPRPTPCPEWQTVDFQHVPPLFPENAAAANGTAANGTVSQTAEKPPVFSELKPAASETLPAEFPLAVPSDAPSSSPYPAAALHESLPGEREPVAVSESANAPVPVNAPEVSEESVFSPSYWTGPERIQGSVISMLVLSALSLVPAFLMMTTSFVRIFVVLSILRHGFGTQGIPGTQILAALALFMTLFIMYPTWERTWHEGVVPYQEGRLTSEEAFKAGAAPIRSFMAHQLERTGNTEEILLFWRSSSTPPDESRLAEYTADDVPLQVLLPAFMLSELKTAFLIGVQLLIPMLVIDLLVSSILVSMGMFMLPPTMVSLPFKLLLFVLADGWRLVVEMLLVSF